MKTFIKGIPLLAIGWSLSFSTPAAELGFSSAFTSSMVLQRQVPITITGSGSAGGEVKVSFGPQEHTAKVDEKNQWRVTFHPLPAGGPYLLKLSDGNSEVTLDDILVGDVWIFSGQSNMQMGLGEADGGEEATEAASAEMPVRLLSMPKAGAGTPQVDPGTKWKRCSTSSLPKFSAVAWFFAHHLRQDPTLANVPLGLIDSSFGGTSVEAWTPTGTLPELPDNQISASMFGIPPGSLFNRMIAPLLAYPIKGVCWYQGEANAGHPTVYSQLLQNFITQWRQQWQQPNLPFFIVQLPAYDGKMDGLDFSWLREAQAKACNETPNAWIVVTHDTTDGFDLHPREKEEIGRRVSLLARREVYGQDITAEGPHAEGVEVRGDHVVITFDQTITVPNDKVPVGFALAGADGNYRYAEATIKGREVSLHAEGVPAPQTVRYAWGAQPKANLTGRTGLPVGLFRTDTQTAHTLAFQSLPTFYRIETPVYSLETGRGGSIASLIIGGKQFISNEADGGTRIPGAFGPLNLAHAQLTGPRMLTLSEGNTALEITCDDNSMTWTVANRGNSQINFQITLAPQVEVHAADASAELSRGQIKIEVEGIDHSEEGRRIVSKVPPHGSTELHWTLLSQ